MKKLHLPLLLILGLIVGWFVVGPITLAVAQTTDNGIPPEVIQFLTPYVFAPAVTVITLLVQFIKGKISLGKFDWLWGFIFSAIFSVGQKFICPLINMTPIQTEWGYIILMTLALTLACSGTYTIIKNSKQGITGE